MAFLSYLFYYVPLYFGGNEQALDNLFDLFTGLFEYCITSLNDSIGFTLLVPKIMGEKFQEPSVGHFSGLDLRHRINSPQHSLDHRNNVSVFFKKKKTQPPDRSFWTPPSCDQKNLTF